ncbi:probable methyltransferase-like protein 24 [Mercenaria mercenaria]|uniref:probable methyltransferase-like protein 24 n=1 Tax=Mercenaria mercenaria TaxID=6596 RepID=UPI00234F3789|nr:probable methyltransferase-like protein 24 [Mercenaria mercenaria]
MIYYQRFSWIGALLISFLFILYIIFSSVLLQEQSQESLSFTATNNISLQLRRNEKSRILNSKRKPIGKCEVIKGYLPLPDSTAFVDESILNEYFNYVDNEEGVCHKQKVCGSEGESGYAVCEDQKYKPDVPCTVYSFGSRFQFDFEVDVIKNYICEVHTFDPSQPLRKGIKVPPGVHFHLIGIADKDFTNDDGWEMQTLSTIMRKLGHSRKTIDILKIDIEGWEWKVLPDILFSRQFECVKQLAIEVHFGLQINKTTGFKTFSRNNWGFVSKNEQIDVLKRLQTFGFKIFKRKANPVSKVFLKRFCREITTCNVLSLINLEFERRKCQI